MDACMLSVIVPVHNGAAYLKESLGSLGSQSLVSCEFIVVDDGSTDASWQIMNDCAQVDGRFKLLRQDKAGAAAARNLGLSKASGKYVLFLDSDDYFYPDFIKMMVESMEEHSCSICVCDYVERDCLSDAVRLCRPSSGLDTETVVRVASVRDLPHRITCSPWNKVFLRSLILENGIEFQDIANTNDAYFISCATLLSDSVFFLSVPLLEYRINRGGSLQDGKTKHPECALEAARKIARWASGAGVSDEWKTRFLAIRCTALALATVQASVGSREQCARAAREARSFLQEHNFDRLKRSDFSDKASWLKYRSLLNCSGERISSIFCEYGYSRTHSYLEKFEFGFRLALAAFLLRGDA